MKHHHEEPLKLPQSEPWVALECFSLVQTLDPRTITQSRPRRADLPTTASTATAEPAPKPAGIRFLYSAGNRSTKFGGCKLLIDDIGPVPGRSATAHPCFTSTPPPPLNRRFLVLSRFVVCPEAIRIWKPSFPSRSTAERSMMGGAADLG